MRLYAAGVAAFLFIPHGAFSSDFNVVMNMLSDSTTSVKREAFWNENKGAAVKLRGKVENVKAAGWVTPMTVEIAPDGGGGWVSVSCYIEEDNSASIRFAQSLDIGDRVSCQGDMSNYVLVLGALSLSLEKASISK